MGKTKVSRVKKTNKLTTKLRRQGKLKHKRNRKIVVKPRPQPVEDEFEDEEQVPRDVGKEMLSMMETEDLEFLKDAVVKGSYSMFQGPEFNRERKLLKRRAEEDESDIEEKYEDGMEALDPNKRKKLLLPIKTKSGLVRREIEVDVKERVVKEKRKKKKKGEEEDEEEEKEEVVDEDNDDDVIDYKNEEKDLSKPVSMAEMLAWREQAIAQYKFKIGILCSGLLENPQEKVMNIQRLLEVYDDWHPELQITLKKLVLVSLLEVFKDILPSYQIKHQDDSNVKLKKDTRQLQMFEKSLLKGYRGYLTKLEKACAKLFRKKGDTRIRTKQELVLGELGINALCELLTTHSYFNYGKNIVRLVIPYLDSKYQSVRTRITEAIVQLFAQDKRGEMTLEVVRRINDLVKTRKHAIKPDAIAVLANLKINDINLDDLKNEEIKKKKLMDKKKRIINLSKKEKKRQKRLAEVEKELLETQAEENKQQRSTLLTEVTKTVFTILFRILKNAPSSGLLSAALQALAKFTQCINIEFYQDLVIVLHNLLANGELKVKEQLNCVLTVFKILSGQGEALNIDPNKFYAHLYTNMFNVHIGQKNNENEMLLLQCLDLVILGRRKKLTFNRLIAFLKRLGTMMLYQEHHMALACLTIMRQMFQLNKSVDSLLDVDTSAGQGIYLPEVQDPEYCNAACTALYELTLLANHYHPTVKKFALYILNSMPATGKNSIAADIAKLASSEIYTGFNPSEMAFKPSVPMPKVKDNIKIKNASIRDKKLSELCERVLAVNFKAEFSELLDMKPKIKKEEKD